MLAFFELTESERAGMTGDVEFFGSARGDDGHAFRRG